MASLCTCRMYFSVTNKMSSVESAPSSSLGLANIAIIVGIVGIYGFITYLFFFKKPPTLADVLKATDFGSVDECSGIFSQFAKAANGGCGATATNAFCDACSKPGLSAGARALCSDSSAVALCRARSS